MVIADAWDVRDKKAITYSYLIFAHVCTDTNILSFSAIQSTRSPVSTR